MYVYFLNTFIYKVLNFIITFSCRHSLYFDHIHPITLPAPLTSSSFLPCSTYTEHGLHGTPLQTFMFCT